MAGTTGLYVGPRLYGALVPFEIELVPFTALLSGVPAVVRAAEASHATLWRDTWAPELARQSGDDRSWDWSSHIQRGLLRNGFLCLAIVTDRLEGLASLAFDRSRAGPPGTSLVYIEYLATAPWNRKAGSARLRGVGRVLIQTTVRISVALGHDGRIGLHSKPAAEAFHREKLGLLDLGREMAEDGEWVYFEATPEVARRLL